MSKYFPHTAYAEDQPLAKTILTTHVATRAITLSTLIGGIVTLGRNLLRKTPSPVPLPAQLLRSGATATAVGIGLGAAMTAGRMAGREEIEWKDRAWRLLENQGQVETDDWTYGAMAAGGVAGAVRGGIRGGVGGVGWGSVVGMVGYLGWRYGVNGGEFGEVKRERDV